MSKEYFTTIGLEIHAELKTESKMFCRCKNDPFNSEPNTNICPICMAHPGTLPSPNKKAIESVIRVGLALGGDIAEYSEFDRKNYFYPDIPKGYQISQYKYPIVSGGELKGVKITRIHLEEDTGTSIHDKGDETLLDFNRAGVPLMELVTEPVIHDAKTAGDFGRELQLLLRFLGVSDANMEKGEMRVELNISVSDDPNKFGTKVEVKNLNSFKTVEKAAEYETKRMIELLEAGKGDEIVQETRGWNDAKGVTFSQRKKENSQDYRYFPDPDIPKFDLHKMFDLDSMRNELPELPEAKRRRYANDFGVKAEDIESYILDTNLASNFEAIAQKLNDKEKIRIASNYVTSDFLGLKKIDTDIKFPNVEHFVELIEMVSAGELTSKSAKEILASLTKSDFSPRKYAEEHDLLQKNDEGAIRAIAQEVISQNEKVVDEYKAGKETAIQFLVGQVMKASRGSANPGLAKKILEEELGR